MPPSDHQSLLQEIHRLTLENNRLLHKMRRAAVWSRLLTLIFYAVLFLGPIWFYMQYLNGSVQNALQAYQKAQGTGAAAQSQLQSMEQAFQQFEARFQSLTSTSSQK